MKEVVDFRTSVKTDKKTDLFKYRDIALVSHIAFPNIPLFSSHTHHCHYSDNWTDFSLLPD